ncbi:Mannose-specific lectin [Liparis tanakae]|uniref:Mannose-specific lectin n=1 Tax=Liparis tanakae TaxID=230148 RepID=A0A4Z2EPA1_9TELE|nr:Mannose-specific lectin [Liparis tanakae]
MSKNYLSKNDELRKGDYLMSNNGNFKAIFQEDGNFVLYGWSPVWASDTCGSDGVRVCMQADCNLVMYNQQSEAKWHTNSAKDGGSMCRLHLTNDGKLLVDKESVEIWNSDQSEGKNIMSKNYLSKNDELRKGDYLMSNNGNFKAVFQVSN